MKKPDTKWNGRNNYNRTVYSFTKLTMTTHRDSDILQVYNTQVFSLHAKNDGCEDTTNIS
jgi:hypothetical protein